MIYRNNIIKLYHKIELVISTFWWNPGPQQILHLCLNQLYNTSFYLVFTWVAKLDFEYIYWSFGFYVYLYYFLIRREYFIFVSFFLKV